MIISDLVRNEKKLFIRDPENSELGQKIINNSIKLIDEISFDEFTFKKLATYMNSTEASIYRYFENKNKLLMYLVTWYWSWIKYKIDFQTINLGNQKDKLKVIIKIICEPAKDIPSTNYIDEKTLSKIVIMESGKAYSSKMTEEDFKNGLFEAYKEVCNKIAVILKAINPKYPNPKALATTLINTAHKQSFDTIYLKEITDLDFYQIEEFLENMILFSLKWKK